MRSTALLLCLSLALALTIPTLVSADWDGGITGGTVIRDGSSATRLRLSLVQDERPLTHALYAEWIDYTEGSGYRLGYLPRFWVDEKLYLFGEGELRVDKPLGIESGYLAAGGVGYRLFDTAERSLDVEVGAGLRGTTFENPEGGDDNDDDSESIALARVRFDQRLFNRLRADADAFVIEGERVGEQAADVGITWLVGDGGVRAGYQVRRLTQGDLPAITDDSTSLSLTYGF